MASTRCARCTRNKRCAACARKHSAQRREKANVGHPTALRHGCREIDGNNMILRDEPRKVIRTPEEYLTEIGMSLECLKEHGDSEFVVVSQRLNTWPVSLGKGDVGEFFQVELRLVRRKPIAVTMPALSASRIVLPKPPARPPVRTGVQRAIILPDMQIGYRRDLRTGRLMEFHDRNAIDLSIQIILDVKPDVVVLLGDNLDLPEWSTKFVRSPEMYFTTEPAKREYAYILGRIRAAVPYAKIVVHLGNHEARVETAAATYMLGAGGLQGPSGHDYLSVPSMVDPDNTLNLTWLPYPDGEFWLTPNVRTIHGIYADSVPGATARKYLLTARCSTFFGHIHRREAQAVTHWFAGGQRTYCAESPGCLCHTDGRVPGSSAQSNWQNGINHLEYEPIEGGLFTSEWVPIFGGRALFKGHRYEGQYDVNALADATEWDTFKRAA